LLGGGIVLRYRAVEKIRSFQGGISRDTHFQPILRRSLCESCFVCLEKEGRIGARNLSSAIRKALGSELLARGGDGSMSSSDRAVRGGKKKKRGEKDVEPEHKRRRERISKTWTTGFVLKVPTTSDRGGKKVFAI